MSANDSRTGDSRLLGDMQLLGSLLDETLRAREGEEALALVEGLRRAAIALRDGTLPGGRDGFARRVASLDLEALEQVARAFTQFFHLVNVAEEQQRIRALPARDRSGPPSGSSIGGAPGGSPGGSGDGSIATACLELARAGAPPDHVRALLG